MKHLMKLLPAILIVILALQSAAPVAYAMGSREKRAAIAVGAILLLDHLLHKDKKHDAAKDEGITPAMNDSVYTWQNEISTMIADLTAKKKVVVLYSTPEQERDSQGSLNSWLDKWSDDSAAGRNATSSSPQHHWFRMIFKNVLYQATNGNWQVAATGTVQEDNLAQQIADIQRKSHPDLVIVAYLYGWQGASGFSAGWNGDDDEEGWCSDNDEDVAGGYNKRKVTALVGVEIYNACEKDVPLVESVTAKADASETSWAVQFKQAWAQSARYNPGETEFAATFNATAKAVMALKDAKNKVKKPA